MPDFDIDLLKKTWQDQKICPKYACSEILEMLNKKSRNIVKYIFWISAAEFLVFLSLTIIYIFQTDDNNSVINIIERAGAKKTYEMEKNLAHLYFLMKIVSLLVTGIFAVKFYSNYRKIRVEENLKKIISRIVNFRQTVNRFILANFAMVILFSVVICWFIYNEISAQQVQMNPKIMISFVFASILVTAICIGLVWIYYRVVYGIMMKKLGKNLEQLKEIESI